jgi:hypothetical protein
MERETPMSLVKEGYTLRQTRGIFIPRDDIYKHAAVSSMLTSSLKVPNTYEYTYLKRRLDR